MPSEIDWQDEPALVAPGQRAELIRCGPGSLPPLIALNTRHVGTEMHFWQGRSFPHLKQGCPACAAKNTAVWKGYLGVWNPSTRLTGILEFTLGCVSSLDAHFLAHGTCRGASIHVKRSNGKANGKLLMTCERSIWGQDQLPPAPDIRLQLSVMWGSKRVDDFINVHPTRPVVEAPESSTEVLERRRNLDALMPDSNGERSTISLQDAGRLLATRFQLEGQPTNGKGTHE